MGPSRGGPRASLTSRSIWEPGASFMQASLVELTGKVPFARGSAAASREPPSHVG